MAEKKVPASWKAPFMDKDAEVWAKKNPRLKQVLVHAVWQAGFENWRFPRVFGEGFNIKKRAFFSGERWKPFFTYEKPSEDIIKHYRYEAVVVFEDIEADFNIVRAKKFATDRLKRSVLQDTLNFWKSHLTENGRETFEKKTDGALERLGQLVSDERNYAEVPEKAGSFYVHTWKV